MKIWILTVALMAPGTVAAAQSGTAPLQKTVQAQPAAEAPQVKDISEAEIIRQFSARETAAYEAWMQYTYHQVAEVRVNSVNGVPTRESMTTISDIIFKDDGTREVQVKRRAGNLRSVVYTMNDEQVINDLQPFALTEKELPLYNLSYVGKERIDELNCYVFSVAPKSTKGKRLFFQGRIYVDDRDLQIVRTVGKPVPQKRGGEQFPEFETIRQIIDKEYWFPVWTHAESHLRFDSDTVHIEETITYSDYKRFASKTTIQFEPIQ
jgi:outer membrane lipoprotein-sorting protein